MVVRTRICESECLCGVHDFADWDTSLTCSSNTFFSRLYCVHDTLLENAKINKIILALRARSLQSRKGSFSIFFVYILYVSVYR